MKIRLKTIREILINKGDPSAAFYSGCDQIDMSKIADDFKRDNPEVVDRLLRMKFSSPSRPDNLGDNIMLGLKLNS